MRNRGLSKLYLIVGTAIAVVLLFMAVRLLTTQAHPERHITNEDPEQNELHTAPLNPEPRRSSDSNPPVSP